MAMFMPLPSLMLSTLIDHFATLNLVNVLIAVYLLVVAVYLATLFDVVVVTVLHTLSPFDVLNPFHPFASM